MCVFAGVFEKDGLQVWCFCGQFVVRCVANVVCKWALRRRGKCAIFFNFIFEGVMVLVSGGLAENKQGQRRRVGWLRFWWRSGFLRCAAHDEAVSRFGRNDGAFMVEEKGIRVATLPAKMRGFFAALR